MISRFFLSGAGPARGRNPLRHRPSLLQPARPIPPGMAGRGVCLRHRYRDVRLQSGGTGVEFNIMQRARAEILPLRRISFVLVDRRLIFQAARYLTAKPRKVVNSRSADEGSHQKRPKPKARTPFGVSPAAFERSPEGGGGGYRKGCGEAAPYWVLGRMDAPARPRSGATPGMEEGRRAFSRDT